MHASCIIIIVVCFVGRHNEPPIARARVCVQRIGARARAKIDRLARARARAWGQVRTRIDVAQEHIKLNYATGESARVIKRRPAALIRAVAAGGARGRGDESARRMRVRASRIQIARLASRVLCARARARAFTAFVAASKMLSLMILRERRLHCFGCD